MSPIEAAYLSAKDRLCGMSLAEFEDSLTGSRIEPVCVSGAVVGAVIVIGCEVHACVLPEFKGLWLNRRLLRVLDEVIKSHGYATTSATTNEGRRFVERLGFIREGDIYVKRVCHGH